MGWRVIYIDLGEYCSLYLDNLKMENSQRDKELIIPLKDIHTLIIDNYKTVLSTQLINAFTKYNINVVLCNIQHMPQSLIIPHQGSKSAPMMLRKQLSWTNVTKSIVHMNIVKAKIYNQLNLLKFTNCDIESITMVESFYNTLEIGDTTNREGLAAKVYFRALFGKTFKRFKDDVINDGLNYGYSILRSQISKAILAKGLHPSLGFFHHGPENHFNLSDDFIEPFRPLIDIYVYEFMLEEQVLTKDHRLNLIIQTTKDIYYKNLKHTFFNVINQYIDGIIAYVETGDLTKIDMPIIKYNEL